MSSVTERADRRDAINQLLKKRKPMETDRQLAERAQKLPALAKYPIDSLRRMINEIRLINKMPNTRAVVKNHVEKSARQVIAENPGMKTTDQAGRLMLMLGFTHNRCFQIISSIKRFDKLI